MNAAGLVAKGARTIAVMIASPRSVLRDVVALAGSPAWGMSTGKSASICQPEVGQLRTSTAARSGQRALTAQK